MGFGTLFVGYFLILNFAYTSFTDAIAGILMLYGLYKLSKVNREFTISAIFAAAFTVLGVTALVFEMLNLLSLMADSALINSIIAIARAVLLGLTTAYMLLGMQTVSAEVGLNALSSVCKRLYILTLPIYSVALVLEIFGLFSLSEVQLLAILSVISIVANLTLTVLILVRIYDCLAKICMPEDREIPDAPKKSKLGFVNAFRKHEEEKQREYAEYRLHKFKKKMEKKRNSHKK